MLKIFLKKNGLKLTALFILALITAVFLWQYLNSYLKRSKAEGTSITLSLIPATLSFSNQEVKEIQLIAQFSGGSATEKIDYLKVKINFPKDNLELADYVDTTASSLGRQIRVDGPVAANGSGVIVIELGASSPGSGPATNSEPVTIAKIKLKGKSAIENGAIAIDNNVEIYNNLAVAISQITKNNATFSVTVSGPTNTPTPVTYQLTKSESGTVIFPVSPSNGGYAIYAILKTTGGTVIASQQDFTYQWTIDNPTIASISPFTGCTNGIQPPCPEDHLGMAGLTPGSATVRLTVQQTSTQTNVASTTFPILVTAAATSTPIPPTVTPNPNCLCAADACTSSCVFDKFALPITYTDPIKCSLSDSLFSTVPSAANKTAWCQANKRTKGDANGDGVINTTDYFYYVAAFYGGQIPVGVNPDFNGDGNITIDDRAIIIKSLKLQ